MPLHDWTRVSAGTFHDFHCTWIPLIKIRLNDGLLPAGYYAQVEQVAGELTTEITASLEAAHYAAQRKQLVVRHSSDDQVIAVIEIVSPGNKAGRRAYQKFIEKAVSLIEGGRHLLVIDLFPPGPRDPQGVHGAIWAELGDESYKIPGSKRLTLAAYKAGDIPRAFVQPVAVGDRLAPMPLFFGTETYVNVPLEETYEAAYRSVPQRWRTVLETR